MNSDKKSFNELFKEAVELRGLNLERLAETTGIPRNYLAAFIAGDLKKLPPLPYVRGYLMKISEVLGIDGNYLWALYKEEISLQLKNSDHLPINRFAIKRINKKKIIFGIVLIFAIIYIAFRFNNLVGIPEIKIIQPTRDNLIVNERLFELSGEINNFFDKLTINGEEISVEKSGKFEKEYQLQPGANKIEFKVKRFLGKEIKVEREIIYQL